VTSWTKNEHATRFSVIFSQLVSCGARVLSIGREISWRGIPGWRFLFTGQISAPRGQCIGPPGDGLYEIGMRGESKPKSGPAKPGLSKAPGASEPGSGSGDRTLRSMRKKAFWAPAREPQAPDPP